MMIAFFHGVARILDLFGVYDPPLELGSLEDDSRALYNDQLIVMRDFYGPNWTPEVADELDRS